MGMKPRTRPLTMADLDKWARDIGCEVPMVRVQVNDHRSNRQLGVFDFLPSRADIEEQFGKGRFRLSVKRRNESRKLVYAGHRTVEI